LKKHRFMKKRDSRRWPDNWNLYTVLVNFVLLSQNTQGRILYKVKRLIWFLSLVAEGSKQHGSSILVEVSWLHCDMVEKPRRNWPCTEEVKCMGWCWLWWLAFRKTNVVTWPIPVRQHQSSRYGGALVT
jgi:hypothetical protein